MNILICARLLDNPECPDLLVCSVYNTKPVHVMTSAASCVDWITMKRKVYLASEKKMVMMEYLQLNLIYDYNNHMNIVDLADKLRNCYRFNHWMRNRKWWWAIFL
jgi:hypothetical protein